MSGSQVRLLGVVAALAAALTLAACGSSNSSSTSTSGGASGSASTPAATKDAKVAALVPAQFKGKTLNVASDASYPPNEFFGSNGKAIQGWDVDLINALAQVMGVKVKVQNATFDSIIPGLAAKKYDIGLSSFTDTKEREKTVDFVTYYRAGETFFTKASGGVDIKTIADICGHTVAAEKGTTEADDATAQSKKCTAAGKKAVKVNTYPDQSGANLALASGRADLGFADSPIAEYQVKKSNGQFEVVGQTVAPAPYGIALPKNSGLDKPLLAAVKALMANGQYKAILTKWGVEGGAITNPQINGATS